MLRRVVLWKLAAPILLVILALLPVPVVRVFVFETLALPFGTLLNGFRYTDMPYLNLAGVLIVACVWALISYVAASAIAWTRKRPGP